MSIGSCGCDVCCGAIVDRGGGGGILLRDSDGNLPRDSEGSVWPTGDMYT